MIKAKPYLLSIAGHDPSSGAGLNADIKVFNALQVHGLSVCTSITYQSEDLFLGVNWLNDDQVLQQLSGLSQRYSIAGIKFGLVPNLEMILKCIEHFDNLGQKPFVIWDPILKASSGFDFEHNLDHLNSVLSKIDLLTPNLLEYESISQHIKHIPCSYLLKGGHSEGEFSHDILHHQDKELLFKGHKINYDKHGTGCVLSSAILVYVAKGFELEKACELAKSYIVNFLKSDDSLLGFH